MSHVTADQLAALWFDRVWNQLDESAIDELFASDGVAHGVGPDIHGPADFHLFHTAFTAAFENIHVDILDQLVDGDRVMVRAHMTMTHRASGKDVVLEGTVLLRVVNGQIVQGWNYFNFADFLAQLGLIPDNALELAISGAMEVHAQV